MRASVLTIVILILTTIGPAAAVDVDTVLGSLDAIRDSSGLPAYALVLVEDDAVRLCESRGIADLADQAPVTGETRFRIGSVTKTFTAIAVLIAHREHDLDIDAPIRDLVAEPLLRNTWAASRPVTIAQLLEHSAGLQDWAPDEWDLNTPMTLAAALEFRPDSRTVRWPPGMFASYSNNGPGVAARVLELRTGMTYEDFMSERVFDALGMETASLQGDPDTLRLLATGYDTDGQTIIPYWNVIFRPAAAISLNPCDMAPLIRMFIGRGELDGRTVLSREDALRLETPETTLAARHELKSGYGLGLRNWQHQGHLLFGHGGDADGYLSHFGYSLESGRGYFLVINVFLHPPLREMRRLVEDWVVDPLPPADREAVAVTPAAMGRIIGSYRQLTRRFPHQTATDPLQVVSRDGVLSTRIGTTTRELVPVSPGLFRRPWQSRPTVVFVEGGDGRRYLIGDFGNYARLDGHGSEDR